MTGADAAGAAPGTVFWPRMVGLHLASRRVPSALVALAACALALRGVLSVRWFAGDPGVVRELALVLETGPAVVLAATTRSPFGEPERVTGRRLPWLRLAALLGQVAAAAGLFAAASAGAHAPGGVLETLRDAACMTGVGLLFAAAIGGTVAWAGPLAYLVMAESALAADSAARWIWPARPLHDHAADGGATLLLAVGVAVVTVRGARDSTRE